ncbi:hypothetical protein WP50_26275, partial [Lactiplantibacillus plantarum]
MLCAVKLSEAVFANARLACPVSAYSETFGTYVGQPAIIGKDGVIDFAGGTVVHINAGITALVLSAFLGARHK